MTSNVLETIRQALRSGPINSTESHPLEAERARLFFAEADRKKLIDLFAQRARSSGASVHVVGELNKLSETIGTIISDGERLAVDRPDVISERLGSGFLNQLKESYRTVVARQLDREEIFKINVAITPVDFAIAETGSIIISAGSDRSRMSSLTSDKHIALIWADQIVPDLMDLPAQFKRVFADNVPPGFTIISGPSKTADIEMNLVIGVHGPGELHLIVLLKGIAGNPPK